MVWGRLLIPEAWPQGLAILGMLVLAAVLVRLKFARRANRAFAVFLVLRAVTMLAATMAGLANLDPPQVGAGVYWSSILPYFAIAVPFAALYFACVYPRPRWWFGTHPAGPYILLAAALGAEAIYVVDHGAWATYVTNASGQLVPAQLGPLSLATGVAILVFGFVAAAFAVDFTRMRDGPLRRSTLFVALGFAVTAAFDGAGSLGVLAGGSDPSVRILIAAAALGPVLVALAVLWHHARRVGEPADRTAANRFTGVVVLAAISGYLPLLVPGMDTAFLLATGVWRLAFPALVAYALVRYELFGIDLRIKWTVQQSTVAAVFVAVFFIVSEGAQELLSARIGPLLGIVAAGGLVFALAPLQRVAERVSDAAVPGVAHSSEYMAYRKLQVYRAALEEAIFDGQVTQRERRVLDTLRRELRIADSDAEALERDILDASSGPGSA